MKNKPMRRVFFGLEIPAEIKNRLLQVRAEVAGAKWQSVEQMHLTSLFLGDIDEECLLAVREVAQPEAPVVSLHSAIQNQVESLGLHTERRAYRPHLTLARFEREPGSVEHFLDQYRETLFGTFQVDEFVLFESEQSCAGSVYTVLERYPLSRSAV